VAAQSLRSVEAHPVTGGLDQIHPRGARRRLPAAACDRKRGHDARDAAGRLPQGRSRWRVLADGAPAGRGFDDRSRRHLAESEIALDEQALAGVRA
jgi:hypothetical protein